MICTLAPSLFTDTPSVFCFIRCPTPPSAAYESVHFWRISARRSGGLLRCKIWRQTTPDASFRRSWNRGEMFAGDKNPRNTLRSTTKAFVALICLVYSGSNTNSRRVNFKSDTSSLSPRGILPKDSSPQFPTQRQCIVSKDKKGVGESGWGQKFAILDTLTNLMKSSNHKISMFDMNYLTNEIHGLHNLNLSKC